MFPKFWTDQIDFHLKKFSIGILSITSVNYGSIEFYNWIVGSLKKTKIFFKYVEKLNRQNRTLELFKISFRICKDLFYFSNIVFEEKHLLEFIKFVFVRLKNGPKLINRQQGRSIIFLKTRQDNTKRYKTNVLKQYNHPIDI